MTYDQMKKIYMEEVKKWTELTKLKNKAEKKIDASSYEDANFVSLSLEFHEKSLERHLVSRKMNFLNEKLEEMIIEELKKEIDK